MREVCVVHGRSGYSGQKKERCAVHRIPAIIRTEDERSACCSRRIQDGQDTLDRKRRGVLSTGSRRSSGQRMKEVCVVHRIEILDPPERG